MEKTNLEKLEESFNKRKVNYWRLLTLVFIHLKLSGAIDWSWFWVLFPWVASPLIIDPFLVWFAKYVDEYESRKSKGGNIDE